MNTQARAFVLGMGLTVLGVTWSLGEAGVRATGVAVTRSEPELFSRYCEPFVCPGPVTEPERALDLLRAAGDKLDRPAVPLPARDAFALILSRNRTELGRCFAFALPASIASAALVDKWLHHQLAERTGSPCSRAVYPGSLAGLSRIRHETDDYVIDAPIM